MSGIYGFYSKVTNKPKDADLDILKRWNSIYGRDGHNYVENNNFGLGCHYEKISVHPQETDCVFEIDNRIFSIDAIVYNREELIGLLHLNEDDNNISDERLIARVLINLGVKGLRNINGDFAGAMYSEETGDLYLFRDHMGARTLFYYMGEGLLAFSTDIRGLTSMNDVKTGVDESWLFSRISGRMLLSQTQTSFANIVCVNPGCCMVFHNNGNKIESQLECYWKAGEKKTRFKSDAEYIKRLRELIEDAVKIRSEAYPGGCGAELSGGLDSSVISLLLGRMNKAKAFYSWSKSPEALPYVDKDERLAIKEVCDLTGIECGFCSDEDMNSAEKIVDNVTRSVVGNIDENLQFAYRNMMPPYFNVVKMMQVLAYCNNKGTKVVFTGHGGDEGVSHRPNVYELYRNHEYYHYFRNVWATTHGKKNRPACFLREVRNNLSTGKDILTQEAKYDLNADAFINSDFADRMSQKKYQAQTFFFDPISYVREGGSRPRLELMALFGGYFGMRYVAPFLDYRVIDFALTIPRYMYIKGKMTRYIYREAFKDILPKSIYKLANKRTASIHSERADDGWYEYYDRLRKEILDSLDKDLWSQYLDFDSIDDWVKQGKPQTEEEDVTFDRNFYFLGLCEMINNCLHKQA
ncbi:MAG: hypothetical protein IKR39_09615 [Lachnospiraceae bacterium]|nr:hypothetical protein [Lachnospiraceae bacterium]